MSEDHTTRPIDAQRRVSINDVVKYVIVKRSLASREITHTYIGEKSPWKSDDDASSRRAPMIRERDLFFSFSVLSLPFSSQFFRFGGSERTR